ncbi:L-aspartate oxidase [[Phormidium ambiguum] IAM M-71]|uniref:L-aspartate oxidase n=1 Tax=[Phormidium ambiguum] IAM M-71 TaxID=454136 RepID=A0A1U7IB01_9CYAN|nr:L-aspartate oxidase [Phormidium ambiguum IAM M-71]
MSSSLANRFDVLVVGAGAAGLYTALCLPESLQVGLISKDSLPLSASDWAQGGIAAVVDPSDSSQLHIDDTMHAGAGLCELEAVKFLVEQAPSCIDSLVQMGVGFDRKDDRLALTLEAAHSRPRVLHAADTTGRAVVSTLTAKVLERQNIHVLSPAFVLDLWMSENGDCQGVSLIYQGELLWVSAGAVVLATGGGGQVFSQTTNPAVSTGDGVALAYRAGAIVRDLEFCQFHPTALMKPDAPHFLISEAVRGEGAHLVDSQGYRFAFDYHPKGELAPRDVVSRSIFHHLKNTGEPHVWLDLRPIPPEKIRYRFPNIIQVCQHWGIDVFSEPIPVSPAAHYWMGGILVDLMNQTSIPGLYAVGETASTGVHGANRLASNSLLECIVFGAQMRNLQLRQEVEDKGTKGQGDKEKISLLPSAFCLLPSSVELIREELPQLMWRCAGISRRGEELESAIAQVELWQKEFAILEFSQFFQNFQPPQSVLLNFPDIEAQIKLWGETRNLLDVAYLILRSAVFRTESRGGHYRADFPETSPEWQVHTLVKNNQWWKSSVLGSGD